MLCELCLYSAFVGVFSKCVDCRDGIVVQSLEKDESSSRGGALLLQSLIGYFTVVLRLWFNGIRPRFLASDLHSHPLLSSAGRFLVVYF